MKKHFLVLCSVPILCLQNLAQEPGSPSQQQSTNVLQAENLPTYHVIVVSRTTKAVNYRHHSGATSVDFRGADLMPGATGHARIESRTGRIEIDANFDYLQPPRSFGPEFLTYVLWAITPEGRPANLGEIVPKDGRVRSR